MRASCPRGTESPLADAGEPLTLSQLTTEAGYNEGAGTASRALYGVPEGSSSGPEQTGLLELGYVHDKQMKGEGGRAVKHFDITASGKKALQKALASTGGRLPPDDDADHGGTAEVPAAPARQAPRWKRWQCRSYGCGGKLRSMKPNERRGTWDMICRRLWNS